MPIFASLPTELLHIIISQLRAFEIERVAKTFNRTLCAICFPLLAKRLAGKRHAKRMINRFGPIQNLEGGCPNLDILDLKGDLNWLLPLTEGEIDDDRDFPVTAKEDVDDLVKTSKRLGLALPDAFVRFMHSEELQSRVPTSDYFLFGPGGLRMCPKEIDGGAGGYIIRFLCDEQNCFYWSLYLDPNPTDGFGHCVLDDEDDANLEDDLNDAFDEMAANEAVEQEENDKAQATKDLLMATLSKERKLFATDFEGFLAEMYFIDRGTYLRRNLDKLDLPLEVKEYVKQAKKQAHQSEFSCDY